MAKTFHLTIARIGENLYDGEAQEVVLPGKDGVFAVLANHEPLVSELKEGQAQIRLPDGSLKAVRVPEGGMAEVSHNQATVLL